MHVYCIVEGHGEADALGILIRRVAEYSGAPYPARVSHVRIPRQSLLRQGELERALRMARIRITGRGGVLILLDADDDCPRDMAPGLLARVREATDLRAGVVLANREFEAWFLAASKSLRGRSRLSALIEPPENPEGVRDAKGWLTDRMEHGHSYSPPVDQAALTASMDLDQARVARSFDKCYREIVRLLSMA